MKLTSTKKNKLEKELKEASTDLALKIEKFFIAKWRIYLNCLCKYF